MDNIDLSPFCKTKAQANDFVIRLASITERIYETNFNLEAVVQQHLGIQKKDSFLRLLRENNISQDSPELLKAFLTKLQDIVSTLPVLSLTLAFEPTEETLKVFSEWFLLNVKRQVLFTITIDPTLIAGAVISFNGKHVNFSIKSQFDHIVHDVLTQPPSSGPTHADNTPHEQHHQDVTDLHLGR